MVHSDANEQELISSTISEDSHTPLSETVTTLASNVYKELERIIKNFGENSVKDLMPVMISTLESLDNALHEREVSKLEMESLKEQNEQLFQQYEREKGFHKEYQQRYLQIEDHLEEIKRENEEKLQSLESIVKIFEIKARNTSDHVGRLEEKESDMKQEYKRLHDRYCELFKAHCDYMERTKILYGTDRLDQLSIHSPSRGNLQLPRSSDEKRSPTLEPSTDELPSGIQEPIHAVTDFHSKSEIADGTHTQTESMASNDVAVNTAKLAKMSMIDEISFKEFASEIFSKLRRLNLLPKPFDEQQFCDIEDEFEHTNNTTGDDPAISDDDDDISIDDPKNLEAFDKETRNDNIDISDVDASADLFGMTKEVSNLIKENNELLETKNALNVLKDDLLVKIEELASEQEILREEVESLHTVKSRLQSRNVEVEEELRKLREELEKKKEEEENVPTADRKRFTRMEMQRVLLERNQYKQRLFELEEAIHRQDALRASKLEQMHSSTIKPLTISKGTQTSTHHHQTTQDISSSTNKVVPSETTTASSTSKSLWRMFSEDWLPTTMVPTNILGVPVADIQSDLREGTTQISEFFSGLFGTNAKESPMKRSNPSTSIQRSLTHDQIAPVSLTNENYLSEQSVDESSSTAKPSPMKRSDTDENNRFEAYGWSISSKNQVHSSDHDGKLQVNVPMPIYCRPIFNINDSTQIWCAVGIDMSGLTLDSEATSVDSVNKQLIESYHQMVDEQCLKLSSLVWIAAKANDTAMITIIDSNKPEKILDTFTLGNAIIYAMGSIPGSSTSDYLSFDESKLNEITSISDVKITSCTTASLATGGNRSNTIDISESAVADTSQQNVDIDKTKYPTVWLGSSDGWLYIHSSTSEHRTTLAKLWLRHAIYSIIHIRGRVFVTLANEKVVVFHRNTDGTWNLNNFHLIVTGKSRESVRCAINVGDSIWCGVGNRVYVINVQTLEIQKQFEVHSRSEHSVQHMTWSGDGVWLSVRLSSTLQLYHARTYQHLQDVDIQPYVEKMIVTEKTGPYFVHISALNIACRRLWIGTGNGIVISVPLTDSITRSSQSAAVKPGSVVRITDQTPSSNYVPYCSMNNAQLSFHGYRDAVKFFVAVPGQSPSKSLVHNETTSESLATVSSTSPFGDILVVSGGDGYLDFRPSSNTMTENTNRNVSYLIVWHMGSA
ncbi:unnamed protein product [Adineta ricciae]|uniref:Uncharacterized protein n=1 Tax=Adineta ricciae TaxID=249248 RepID=A0A815HGX7_ADIRI|nr:unnamed protein product [Adineta ricciae]